MAKTAIAKKSGKSSGMPAAKVPAATTKKSAPVPAASSTDPSKYAPTKDAVMDVKPGADGLSKLFEDNIKDLYWAENCLVKALPKMMKAASVKSLQDAISNHLEQTKTHVKRLESVFELLGKKPQAKKCDAMEGLTKEGEGVVEDTDPGSPARNLGIIMASQKVEHYEISAYTGMVKLADKLGMTAASKLLAQTLAEEQKSDQTLATIADGINAGKAAK
ncbi:MAG: hypothetical protein JWQ27_2142 [Ferruginibacter sp.]|nr:hypothetical protein [Ferruginibacter sp.]